MKKIFIIVGIILSNNAISQNTLDTSIKPTITYIQSADLHQFTQDELAKLKGNYIVFDGELTEEQIAKDSENSQLSISKDLTQLRNEDFIKTWLSEHSKVKIITQSDYQNSPENVQNEYIKSRCLILSGEVITRQDIQNY